MIDRKLRKEMRRSLGSRSTRKSRTKMHTCKSSGERPQLAERSVVRLEKLVRKHERGEAWR
jgi:hypothetical protein